MIPPAALPRPDAVLARLAWGLGALGLLGAAIGWGVAPRAFLGGWLCAWLMLASLPFGCLGLLLIHAMTGGKWGEALRAPLLAGLLMMPLLLPAGLPLLGAAGPMIPRILGYGALWAGLAGLVVHVCRRRRAFPRLAAVAILLLVISLSLAVNDLCAALDPSFGVPSFGLFSTVRMALVALAIALAVSGSTPGAAIPLGRVLLGLAIFWAYLEFVQGVVLWAANLDRDIPWYSARLRGAWGIYGWLLAAAHVLLPIALARVPQLLTHRQGVTRVALLLIALSIPQEWWMILPSLSLPVGGIALAAMVGFLGCGAGLYGRLIGMAGAWADAAPLPSPRPAAHHSRRLPAVQWGAAAQNPHAQPRKLSGGD